MRKPSRRILFCASLVIMMAQSAADAQQERPDFSGKWAIDVGRSQGLPWLNLKEYSMTVSYNRQAEQLAVKTRIREASMPYLGQAEPKFRPTPLIDAMYRIDGTEVTVQDPVAMTPVEVKQTASWCGEQLELRNWFEMQRDGRKYVWTTIDVWQLSPDGKDLTVQQTIESNRGKQYETLVFNKQ